MLNFMKKDMSCVLLSKNCVFPSYDNYEEAFKCFGIILFHKRDIRSDECLLGGSHSFTFKFTFVLVVSTAFLTPTQTCSSLLFSFNLSSSA